jgi:FkbM family methyltransferase
MLENSRWIDQHGTFINFNNDLTLKIGKRGPFNTIITESTPIMLEIDFKDDSICQGILINENKIEWSNKTYWLRTYSDIDVYSTNRGIIYIPSNEEYIKEPLMKGQALEKYIKTSEHILDIGSHVGTHAIAYTEINPQCVIHCFEAQQYIYNILLKNITVNEAKIVAHHHAVGHTDDIQVTLSNKLSDGSSMNHQLEYGTNKKMNYGGMELGLGGETIDMKTIDSYNFSDVDFIKMDIEGSEKLVFYGAKKTITKFKPTIFYESSYKKVSTDMIKSMNIPKVVLDFSEEAFLKSLGYTLVKVGQNVLAYYNEIIDSDVIMM